MAEVGDIIVSVLRVEMEGKDRPGSIHLKSGSRAHLYGPQISSNPSKKSQFRVTRMDFPYFSLTHEEKFISGVIVPELDRQNISRQHGSCVRINKLIMALKSPARNKDANEPASAYYLQDQPSCSGELISAPWFPAFKSPAATSLDVVRGSSMGPGRGPFSRIFNILGPSTLGFPNNCQCFASPS